VFTEYVHTAAVVTTTRRSIDPLELAVSDESSCEPLEVVVDGAAEFPDWERGPAN
jgi:hypothetical protein